MRVLRSLAIGFCLAGCSSTPPGGSSGSTAGTSTTTTSTVGTSGVTQTTSSVGTSGATQRTTATTTSGVGTSGTTVGTSGGSGSSGGTTNGSTTGSSGGPGILIPASFFGADMRYLTSPWPPSSTNGPAPIKGIRLWDSDVHWAELEVCNALQSDAGFDAGDPANPCYDWSVLDTWVQRAQDAGMDILYTFGAVPAWATSQLLDGGSCSKGIDAGTAASNDPYNCLPPIDVYSDGGGPDAIYTSFVTALATRYTGVISYYEGWNEPDSQTFWAGAPAQLDRMVKDAYATVKAIDPDAGVLSPSFHGPSASTWFQAFLNAGGAEWFDIVNFHGRGANGTNVSPEAFLTVYAQAEEVITDAGLSTRSFWDDEAGYVSADVNADAGLTDPDNQEAYVARAYILQASVGMGRFYWYQWDTPGNGLQGTLPGAGYTQVAQWLVGAALSACTESGTIYTCPISSDGGLGEIAWDTSQTCGGGTCRTNPTNIPGYGHYTDLTGATTAISDGGVPLGAKPLLLQP
jgi:hypothetical protein